MSIEITNEMIEAFAGPKGSNGWVREGLTTVLNMPEVRDAIYCDVRREMETKLKAMGVVGYSLEGF